MCHSGAAPAAMPRDFKESSDRRILINVTSTWVKSSILQLTLVSKACSYRAQFKYFAMVSRHCLVSYSLMRRLSVRLLSCVVFFHGQVSNSKKLGDVNGVLLIACFPCIIISLWTFFMPLIAHRGCLISQCQRNISTRRERA